MMDERSQVPGQERKARPGRFLVAGLIGVLFGVWLLNTPPGLLGKSDAVAYAVCHRIGTHSFYFGGRPFSLCARCSGQYLGFFWGFILQAVLGKKKSAFPGRWMTVLLGAFALFYLIDGLNSLFQSLPRLAGLVLYQPSNILRLFSGLGMGLVISAFYFPLMGQTLWKDYILSKPLEGFRDWSVLVGGAGLIGVLILLDNPLLSYFLILLSTAGLLTLLVLLYTVIWVLIARQENTFQTAADLGWWILAGFGTALLQIALVDGIRFLLTGTWSGYLVY